MSKKTKKLGKSQSRRKAGRRNLSNRNKRANKLDPARSKKRGSRFVLDSLDRMVEGGES